MATAIIGKVVSKKGAKPVVAKPAKVVKETKAVEKPAKAVKSTKWPDKFRVGTIGRTIAEAILDGKLSNAEILDKVKKTHDSDTTIACVSWYKSKWNKEQKA